MEVILGIAGGMIYLLMTDNYGHAKLIALYLQLNVIFFGITSMIGIASGILLGKRNKVFLSLFISLACGIAGLLVLALILPFFAPLAFLSLFGFIYGFNMYLLQPDAPSISN